MDDLTQAAEAVRQITKQYKYVVALGEAVAQIGDVSQKLAAVEAKLAEASKEYEEVRYNLDGAKELIAQASAVNEALQLLHERDRAVMDAEADLMRRRALIEAAEADFKAWSAANEAKVLAAVHEVGERMEAVAVAEATAKEALRVGRGMQAEYEAKLAEIRKLAS